MELDLQDVTMIVQIIDITSQRGAFRGEELAGVGLLRNKLVEELKKVQPELQTPDGEE